MNIRKKPGARLWDIYPIRTWFVILCFFGGFFSLPRPGVGWSDYWTEVCQSGLCITADCPCHSTNAVKNGFCIAKHLFLVSLWGDLCCIVTMSSGKCYCSDALSWGLLRKSGMEDKEDRLLNIGNGRWWLLKWGNGRAKSALNANCQHPQDMLVALIIRDWKWIWVSCSKMWFLGRRVCI